MPGARCGTARHGARWRPSYNAGRIARGAAGAPETTTILAQMPRRESLASRQRRSAPAVLAGAWIIAVLAPAACSLYRPLPLDEGAARPLAGLQVPAGTLLPGGLHSHAFDPSDGLDATEVAMLPVVQGPELKGLRAQAKVTR